MASLVLSCLFGYVWQMTVASVDSAYEAHRLPLIANIVAAVALIGLVLFARRRTDLALTFKVIVPILVVLFALMPMFWSTYPVELNTVMSACYGVFDVISLVYGGIDRIRLQRVGLRDRRHRARGVHHRTTGGHRPSATW